MQGLPSSQSLARESRFFLFACLFLSMPVIVMAFSSTETMEGRERGREKGKERGRKGGKKPTGTHCWDIPQVLTFLASQSSSSRNRVKCAYLIFCRSENLQFIR